MKILVDADVLVGAFSLRDPHYKVATAWLKKLNRKKAEVWVINLVIQEVATVLSHTLGQGPAVEFLERVETLSLEKIMVGENLEARAWEIFKRQTKKGTSFVDCTNMAAVEYYKLDGILSFDALYPKELVNWVKEI